MLPDDAFRALLADRGQAVLPIAGGDTSMAPTLRGGDAVLAVPLEGAPRRGDLLVYRQMDYLVVHRYLGPAHAPDGTRCLRTRGDGRQELDPPLARGNVRAKVHAVRRDGTWRSLQGTRARVYALLMAGHDLAWSALATLAGPIGLGGAVAGVDRLLLRMGAPVVLPLMHRRIASPETSESRRIRLIE